MYKEGDIYVVELEIFRRTLLVCSQASELIFSSERYFELLKLAEQDLYDVSKIDNDPEVNTKWLD